MKSVLNKPTLDQSSRSLDKTSSTGFQLELGAFFALAYLAQGFSSQFGIIAQPLQFMLMRGEGMNAAQISVVTSLMMAPWVVKPFYGMLFDTVPLYGYKRKSYLIIAHILGLAGFLALASLVSPPVVLTALICIAFANAIGTALMLGMAAESGEKSKHYISAQSFYYYLANIVAVLAGGYLCQHVSPDSSLQTAALISCLPVALVGLLIWPIVKENKSTINTDILKSNWTTVKAAAANRKLWLILALATLWNFTPSFGVPLYFHQSNNLQFAQATIGQFSAWYAVGMMIGAIAYRDFFDKIQITKRLYLVALLWMCSISSYFLLTTPESGMVLELGHGIIHTTVILCLYTLASGQCKPGTGVSVMGLLLAARNIATELSTLSGGFLFTHVFNQWYEPLILVGTSGCLLSILLIPFIVRGHTDSP